VVGSFWTVASDFFVWRWYQLPRFRKRSDALCYCCYYLVLAFLRKE